MKRRSWLRSPRRGTAWQTTSPLLINVIRGHKNSNTFGMVRTDSSGNPKPHSLYGMCPLTGPIAG